MNAIVWVGVDPGSRSTGIAARQGNELLGWRVIEREDDESEVGPGPKYVSEVLSALFDVVPEDAKRGPDARLAVEGVRRPNPHVNRRNGNAVTDPTHIIGTAIVLGAVLGVGSLGIRKPLIVPPGQNGSQILATYPHDLVTDAERRHGLYRPGGDSATVRHARSAWDIAGAAPMVELAALAKARTR